MYVIRILIQNFTVTLFDDFLRNSDKKYSMIKRHLDKLGST